MRAEGVYLYDSDGQQILDAMAGLWCVNVGYGRAELAEVARAQMLELPYYNSFFQTAHPPAIELARQLVDVTPPQFNHVFFTGSGSEANDTVVRMVRRYWDLLGEPDRTVIISRENAYHGSTMAGASLGGMAFMHAQGGLPIPGIVHIRQPYWYADGGELSPEEFGLVAAQALEAEDRGAWPGARSRRSSASPSRGPAASSSRRRRTGRRSSASATGTASCWWRTRSSAASAAPGTGLARSASASAPTSWRSRRGCRRATCRSAASWSPTASPRC